MAVLPGVPGIDVRIVVNGVPTEEWPFEENKKREVDEEDAKANEQKLGHVRSEDPQLPTSSNYIQSKSGCRFWVRATLSDDFETSKMPPGADGIAFQIYIDGVIFGTGFSLGTRSTRNWDCAFVKSDDGIMKRHYPVFSDFVSVEDTDNDKINADMARVREMGTIHIWVLTVKLNQPRTLTAQTRDRPDMEMAYKAEDIEDSDSRMAAYLPSLLGRLGNFIFRYSANPPGKVKKGEPELCIPIKRKYEEVKMPDGRSVLDLTGDDDE
ncbi:uncharacterized protein FTJAE_14162 [Fusarium tjaetaba]|uniref:DUF7918 domain-containing protein n=1 Tax=Fusarium tjaetaba TaxID=1567544 RepID=A0A8H5QAL8_9HYPO|nr:uncharacterized protein FTJAE_14162 [Fusarium tjaetaba]KAF5611757.1 hypothetical protein FTJAE_14162 [Fusarium tjaetaba]